MKSGHGLEMRLTDNRLTFNTDAGHQVSGWLADSATPAADVAALAAQLAIDESTISNNTSAISLNTASVTALNTTVATHETRLTADEAAITTLQNATATAAYLTLGIGGVLSILNAAIKWVATAPMTFKDIVCTVGILPLATSINVDVLKNGSTIFTSAAKPTILPTGSGASLVCVPDVKSLAAGDVLTVNLTQVGTITTGAGFQFSGRYV